MSSISVTALAIEVRASTWISSTPASSSTPRRPGHAVCGCLFNDRRGRGLAAVGSRDRPLVVNAEEDGGGLEDAAEVHRFVEVALGRRAVAEPHERRGGFALDLCGPRDSDRVREVSADGNADRSDAMFPCVVKAVHTSVPPPPRQDDRRRNAAQDSD